MADSAERIYCAGGCGNEGPFETGDICSGCVATLQAGEAMAAAKILVAQAAVKLAEAGNRLEGLTEAQDMVVRLRHDCRVAVNYLEPVDPHQLSVITALEVAGEDGLPVVGLATRSGLAIDILTTTLRSLLDANRVEEFTHAHTPQGEQVDPTSRYRLVAVA